jgi:ribosomal protein L11 methyltransferase
MLELFPEGFEEHHGPEGVELAAYTDAGGEERLWHAFGGASASAVPEDWRDRWRAFHRPVRLGRLWIGPPWEQPPRDAVAVVIEPGRAFGTGAHATTRLCLELLLDLPPRGTLVDVGCGSGVLAIAAAKLGLGPVHAFDTDPQAIEATSANAATNGVEITVALADALVAPLPASDLAVANVTLELVERLASRTRARLLITSGYLVSERPDLPGFRHVTRRDREGWAADLSRRESE